MNIPAYATCSMCAEWIEDRCDWTKGSCGFATDAAKEGLIAEGIREPVRIIVELRWDARACPNWEASVAGEREAALIEAEAGHPCQAGCTPDPAEWARKAAI